MDLLLQRIGRLHRHNRRRPERLRTAKCYVLDTADGSLDGGSESVYGKWLLLRTRALLPETIHLPDDIPNLVQDTYQWTEADPLADRMDVQSAKEAYETKLAEKQLNASAFLLNSPIVSRRTKTFHRFLNRDKGASEMEAEASVRDGEERIEVLLLRRDVEGRVTPISKLERAVNLDVTNIPDGWTAQQILKQRICLPASWNERAIPALEQVTADLFPIWQQSNMLKGELILLLEERGKILQTELDGRTLIYSFEMGLTIRKEKTAYAKTK